jgi:hypothetical protein
MAITREQIATVTAPFRVRYKRREPVTVVGFSKNDPLGVGGGLLPSIPTVYFEGGGWLTLDSLMESYSLCTLPQQEKPE